MLRSFRAFPLMIRLSWPREELIEPERSPVWDHPEELETAKQYTFRDVGLSKCLDMA